MKIKKVAIACHKKDLWLANIAIASIRYWYPYIEILLYKDLYSGDFETKSLEKYWKVKVYDQKEIVCGSPLTKLHIISCSKKERILIVDTDVVFAGRVIEYLETFDEDVVVNAEFGVDCQGDWFTRTYYDATELNKNDPLFIFPGYSFNTGQILVTTGVFGLEYLSNYVDFQPRAELKNQKIFKLYDQGLLNYLFPRDEQHGRLRIAKANFMKWMSFRNIEIDERFINLDGIKNMIGIPAILHWAGTVHPDIRKMPNSEIVFFFQRYYYSKVPFGRLKMAAMNSYRKFRYSVVFRKLKMIIAR